MNRTSWLVVSDKEAGEALEPVPPSMGVVEDPVLPSCRRSR